MKISNVGVQAARRGEVNLANLHIDKNHQRHDQGFNLMILKNYYYFLGENSG